MIFADFILRADLHHGWGGEAAQPTSDEAEGGVPNGMAGLGLPYPKKIDESLPANMVCGLQDLPECAQSVLGVALIMITSPIPLIVSHF